MFQKGYLNFDVDSLKAPCLSFDMGFFIVS
jgi:hypothetical protein